MSNINPQKSRKRATLNDEVVRYIWRRLRRGDFQHDIAADLGINPGRVSEINTGKRGASVVRQLSFF